MEVSGGEKLFSESAREELRLRSGPQQLGEEQTGDFGCLVASISLLEQRAVYNSEG